MGLFDLFKRRKTKVPKNIDSIVVLALDELNVTYKLLGENCYIANIERSCGLFRPSIACSSIHKYLNVVVPFIFPVPKNATKAIANELNRLNNFSENVKVIIEENNGATTYHFNGPLTWDQGLSLVKTKDEYSIFAFTDCEFEKTPSTYEIKDLMIHTIDVMDNENFRSLVCAIMGYATYDELEKAMISNAQIKGNEANISMADGYCTLQDKSDGVTSPRYYGRLLMLAIYIIENRISQERAQQLLN